MFAGDTMVKNPRITTFIFITLILIYIGLIGLILANDENDIISICLITMIMFILGGCVYKASFEYKKDNKNILE